MGNVCAVAVDAPSGAREDREHLELFLDQRRELVRVDGRCIAHDEWRERERLERFRDVFPVEIRSQRRPPIFPCQRIRTDSDLEPFMEKSSQ